MLGTWLRFLIIDVVVPIIVASVVVVIYDAMKNEDYTGEE